MGKHRSGPRIPPGIEGVQVNFCKSPICGNFGVAASEARQPRGKGATEHAARDTYQLDSRGNGALRLKCMKCGEKFALKSNQAIHEETSRLLAYLNPLAPQTT